MLDNSTLPTLIVVTMTYISLTLVGTACAAKPLLPEKLAIYYGFPSLVNGSDGDLLAATEVFNDYDLVVLGERLQDPDHPDHTNTKTIINKLGVRPNKTAVYGYIPIGVTNLPSNQTSLSFLQIQQRAEAWAEMGVAGIFLDQAGYDFGVTRERQNQVVDTIHDKGLKVFINAWDPDDVFNSEIDSVYNPMGLMTQLGPDDIYLHESFQIIGGEYQDPSFWIHKSDKGLAYKSQYGTQMAIVTTMSDNAPEFDQGKFDYAWGSALLYGFDFMGWGELHFSVVDNNLPYRMRPNPIEMGDEFTSPIIYDTPVKKRETTMAQIEIDTVAHTLKMTAR
jgi:hypothetical protein